MPTGSLEGRPGIRRGPVEVSNADLLAEAIHDGLVGHRPMDEAVAGYQHRRDALTANGFELTLSTARLAPLSARLKAFYRLAADQPEVIRQIFGVLGGSVPMRDVYSDVRIDATLAQGHARGHPY